MLFSILYFWTPCEWLIIFLCNQISFAESFTLRICLEYKESFLSLLLLFLTLPYGKRFMVIAIHNVVDL